MFIVCLPSVGDYIIDPSLLQQSFEPPAMMPVCLEVMAPGDGFVEASEIFAVGIASSDEAVVLGSDVTAQVTILDVSTGE